MRGDTEPACRGATSASPAARLRLDVTNFRAWQCTPVSAVVWQQRVPDRRCCYIAPRGWHVQDILCQLPRTDLT